MLVKEAKAIARQWVVEEGVKLPGFAGAFYHGSTTWLPDEAPLPATSDLDVMLVLATAQPPVKLGTFRYRGVLLEVSYLPEEEIASAEQVLGRYQLAGSFRRPNVIADPAGRLTTLQATVARDFAKREWVYWRCSDAERNILRNLRSLPEHDHFVDQVLAWLFATGVTTHVLLVAGLQNPTVRRRYLAVRQLLAEYGHSDFYPSLLELLGCAEMSQPRATEHLAALVEVFDATKTLVKTPFFFASELSDLARPLVIDGSRELIERGDQREAIFWMVATYSRCLKVLAQDAPVAVQERFDPG
ncbi:MAG TPA: hypothetical protein PKE45_20400, partial [Caldilineaceae bacterium]|nr:hypothetical protein [Caldilineaceae bacterium]